MKQQTVQAIDVAKMLVTNKWKPNQQYVDQKYWYLSKREKKSNILDCNGFYAYYSRKTGYLIDENDRYAATLNPKVITIYDGNRKYCKIISMQYCEIELEVDRIICGKIIFVA